MASASLSLRLQNKLTPGQPGLPWASVLSEMEGQTQEGAGEVAWPQPQLLPRRTCLLHDAGELRVKTAEQTIAGVVAQAWEKA